MEDSQKHNFEIVTVAFSYSIDGYVPVTELHVKRVIIRAIFI